MVRSIIIALLLAVVVAVVFSAVEALDQYAAVAGLVAFVLIALADSGYLRR